MECSGSPPWPPSRFWRWPLTLAAYVAIRREADLIEQSRVQSARDPDMELEKAGLVSAIEEASDAVVITDSEGTIEYVNPAYTRMTGYSAEEVIGRNPHREKQGLNAAFQQVRETVLAGKSGEANSPTGARTARSIVEDITVAPVRDARRHYAKVHRHPARHDRPPCGQRGQSVSGFHCGVVRRRHYEQHSGRRDSELESGRRAALRIQRGRSSGKACLHIGSHRPAGQPEMDCRPTAAAARAWASSKVWGSPRMASGSIFPFPPARYGTRTDRLRRAPPSCATLPRECRRRKPGPCSHPSWIPPTTPSSGAAPDGAILSWNKGAERMYGYRAEEVLGKPLSMLAPARNIGEAFQLLEESARAKPSRNWRPSR